MSGFIRHVAWFAALALSLLATGCASRSFDAGEIEPAGLRVDRAVGVSLRVYADDRDRREYADELAPLVRAEFDRIGLEAPGDALHVDVCVSWIAPGGAWGEEAECHLQVTIRRAGSDGQWRFSVIGYSGSTWGRDRIPTALREAARGVGTRMADILK